MPSAIGQHTAADYFLDRSAEVYYGQKVDRQNLLELGLGAGFLNMVSRALEAGLEAEWYGARKMAAVREADTLDGRLHKWIAEEQDAMPRDPASRYLRIVTGEFNPIHWNKVNFNPWRALLTRAPEAFDAAAICSPFVALRESAPEDPGVAVDDGFVWHGARLCNQVFDFFLWAIRKGCPNIRLYRSEVRTACHWVAAGGHLAVTDMHDPLAPQGADAHKPTGASGEGFYTNTIRIRHGGGKVRALRDFAEAEFDRALASARDEALNFEADYMEELASQHPETTLDHFRTLIPPHRRIGDLERLEQGAGIEDVGGLHLRNAASERGYRCGVFTLAEIDGLRRILETEEEAERLVSSRFAERYWSAGVITKSTLRMLERGGGFAQ